MTAPRFEARRVEYGEVEALRELYRAEAGCQIVTDSLLRRGLSEPWLLLAAGRVAGYGGVRLKYDPGRLHELYLLPDRRTEARPLFRALLEASAATEIEAQTNMPLLLSMLFDCTDDPIADRILFHDALTTRLESPGARFRRIEPGDAGSVFEHTSEPEGEWVIEAGGEIVATGGFLCHYNPPYGDLYMEVRPDSRRRGHGSYLIQELKRAALEAGKRPAARCDAGNLASRCTLERAGMVPCARMLVGRVRPRGESGGETAARATD